MFRKLKRKIDDFFNRATKEKVIKKLKAKNANFAKVKPNDEAMARTLTGRW